MEKSVIITIMIDNVKLTDLEEIHQKLAKILESYEAKRINTTLQDEPVVRF